MTKFDVYVEKISERRYQEKIASLNEQLSIGVKTRSREETMAELDGVLCAFAPVRVTVSYQKAEFQSV
ncbi:MAG: hypothetical protein IJB97_10435 [Clostridia bacterium]|nr:hypothetical protein [Clostridia bacterium]